MRLSYLVRVRVRSIGLGLGLGSGLGLGHRVTVRQDHEAEAGVTLTSCQVGEVSTTKGHKNIDIYLHIPVEALDLRPVCDLLGLDLHHLLVVRGLGLGLGLALGLGLGLGGGGGLGLGTPIHP